MIISEYFSRPIFQFRVGLDIYPSVKQVYSNNLNKLFDDSLPIDCNNFNNYEYYAETSTAKFFLCSADIDLIMSNHEMMSKLSLNNSSELVKQYSIEVLRRNTALLGSDFLTGSGHDGCISTGRLKLYF